MFRFFKKPWPKDEPFFELASVALVGGSFATARKFVDTFSCDALRVPLSEFRHTATGMIARELAIYCPVTFWVRGCEVFKPSDREQRYKFLLRLSSTYTKIINNVDFNAALQNTFHVRREHNVLVADCIAPIYAMMAIENILLGKAVESEVSAEDESAFMLGRENFFTLSPQVIYRITEYKIKMCIQGLCEVKEGENFGAADITASTAASYEAVLGVVNALLDGRLQSCLENLKPSSQSDAFGILLRDIDKFALDGFERGLFRT